LKRTLSIVKRCACAAIANAALVSCTPHPDDAAVCRAYDSATSGIEVIAEGTVTRLLGTRSGYRGAHEGFVLRLDSGCALSVRVETNTGFTGPIPLFQGERVIAKGEFDDDPDGGVIHWTHRAFGSHHPSGYIQAGGRTYW
jgi:hypothetical protein